MDVLDGHLIAFNAIIRQDLENLSNHDHLLLFFTKLADCTGMTLIEVMHTKHENGMSAYCSLNEGQITFRSSGRYFRLLLDLYGDCDKGEIKACLKRHFSLARWSMREMPHLNPTS